MVRRFLDEDVIRLYEAGKKRSPSTLRATLFWGDSIEVTGQDAKGDWTIAMTKREWDAAKRRYVEVVYPCSLPATVRFRDAPVLRVRFIDVGQGDAAIVETPSGKRILIDGGEELHLHHYINKAYAYLLTYGPVPFEAIVVTHGDADHFAGLTKLVERGGKMPLVSAKRVFHNGLVKGPSTKAGKSVPDREMFGATAKKGKQTYVTALEDDLRKVPDTRMNEPFRAWKAALAKLAKKASDLTVQRLQYGQGSAFSFLDAGITMAVLGPVTDKVGGKEALPFLGGTSASHTVNGHSIVLKMAYGNVRFLFGADLNEESEERLLQRAAADGVSLTSEVLKVPHHGSADFSPRVLEAIRPVVSVVSSGDESTLKEYIHPRAGLVGALGKFSRGGVDRPLVYVTEMVAFFERLGAIDASRKDSKGKVTALGHFQNGYNKKQFGIVHVRTDGQRVLVVTHSGKDDQKESYAFRVDPHGNVAFEDVRLV